MASASTSTSFCQEAPMPALPPPNGFVHKKRKILEDSGSLKRLKWEPPESDDRRLVMFPDDVLLIILSNLDHASLLSLKETCSLFARLCEDYTLWRRVDHKQQPATTEAMDSISRLVHSETKSIGVLGRYNGANRPDDIITVDWLEKIGKKCPNLETLSLPNHFINCSAITLGDFPKSLTCLDLTATQLRMLPAGRSYFRDVYLLIPNLKILILSHCYWFEPHSLMAISKCKRLEELRLNDCYQVKDCLAYCGLSTRGGFRALRTLDLRRCLVTSSELVCFSTVPTLTNLYLENHASSSPLIEPAITVLCTRNEMEVRVDGAREVVNRPQLKVEQLTVRHFKQLTDVTLTKLARDAHSLKFLDVTGCGVTKAGIEEFKALRPNVQLVHAALNEE